MTCWCKAEREVTLLSEAFEEELYATVKGGRLSRSPADEKGAAAIKAHDFIAANKEVVSNLLSKFSADGRPVAQEGLPASAYNDLCKWTLMPVIRAMQRARPKGIICTFDVEFRDEEFRVLLCDVLKGNARPKLLRLLKENIEGLKERRFDRNLFEEVAQDLQLPGWGPDTLDAICGPEGKPRFLVDRVVFDPFCREEATRENDDEVFLNVYVGTDNNYYEERSFIRVSGPWHRVTWLETTLMQAIYDAIFRNKMRRRAGLSPDQSDEAWYPRWLAEAFLRCCRSAAASKKSGLRASLCAGRRSGGLPLVLLQALYLQATFQDRIGGSQFVGMSSVTSYVWLKRAGVDPGALPPLFDTLGHELPMVLGAVYGDVDDKAGMPVTQAIAHAVYFHVSLPKGDVKAMDRRLLMPLLPDTLGSAVFFRLANELKITRGTHAGSSLLDIGGLARHDSGDPEAFVKLTEQFKYKGDLMLSEVEDDFDLLKARDMGYMLFAAGGYFGDSEVPWDSQGKIMLKIGVKVVRVDIDGTPTDVIPLKTGNLPSDFYKDDVTEPMSPRSGSGADFASQYSSNQHAASSEEIKIAIDGQLEPDILEKAKKRGRELSEAAEPKVSPQELQNLFKKVVDEILDKA